MEMYIQGLRRTSKINALSTNKESSDMTVVASSIGHHCVFNIKECVLNGKDKVKGSLFLIYGFLQRKSCFVC